MAAESTIVGGAGGDQREIPVLRGVLHQYALLVALVAGYASVAFFLLPRS